MENEFQVPVKIDDNGVEHNSMMMAGHIGYQIHADESTVQPAVSWFIAKTNSNSITI